MSNCEPDIHPVTTFEEMFEQALLSRALKEKLEFKDFDTPTPIQMQAIPMIKKKKETIFIAETGSGKSFAFIGPLLSMCKPGEGLKALVLAPTRELVI